MTDGVLVLLDGLDCNDILLLALHLISLIKEVNQLLMSADELVLICGHIPHVTGYVHLRCIYSEDAFHKRLIQLVLVGGTLFKLLEISLLKLMVYDRLDDH